jgi:hypothetical protein
MITVKQENIFPNLARPLSGLEELAENLWWRWNPAARMLFKTLDRQAWKESVHNPDKMLRELPNEILMSAARITCDGMMTSWPGLKNIWKQRIVRFYRICRIQGLQRSPIFQPNTGGSDTVAWFRFKVEPASQPEAAGVVSLF